MEYRKIPIISPGLIFVPKAFLLGLFSEGLNIGGNFAFQNGLDFSVKTATCSTNSLLGYIQEGLLSEGYLLMRFGGGGGLIFRRAYFCGGLLSECYGM